MIIKNNGYTWRVIRSQHRRSYANVARANSAATRPPLAIEIKQHSANVLHNG